MRDLTIEEVFEEIFKKNVILRNDDNVGHLTRIEAVNFTDGTVFIEYDWINIEDLIERFTFEDCTLIQKKEEVNWKDLFKKYPYGLPVEVDDDNDPEFHDPVIRYASYIDDDETLIYCYNDGKTGLTSDLTSGWQNFRLIENYKY